MCLIACHMPGSAALTHEEIDIAWANNPHGAGFMFARRGALSIHKPYFSPAKFRTDYRAAVEIAGKTSPIVVHFRFATHGTRNSVNTHPHELCGGQVGMAHNGILPFDPPHHSDISDTVYFARTVLANRPKSQIMGRTYRGILDEMIGPANKLVFLDDGGRVSIVNEESGHWRGGTWFSNAGYQLPDIYGACGLWGEEKDDESPSDPDLWDDDYWRVVRDYESAMKRDGL